MKICGFLISLILFAGCSALYETAMPFNNLGYTTRLFPVQSNNSEKTFRVWFNNGTSIDRIITVSMDSVLPPYGMGYESNFVDIGSVYKRRLFSDKLRNKSVKIFKTSDIQPRSGYDRFFEKLDSLNLFEYQKQTDFIWRFGHRPISFYVVEYKEKDRYTQFYFRTNFPYEINDSTKFGELERLIFDEFDVIKETRSF